MPHRLFVAVDLDAATRASITRAIEPVRTALNRTGTNLRWVPPAEWHLTIAFMAAVDDERMAALKERLRAPLAEPPFTLGFAGIGLFPARGGPPRVLWAGIDEGVEALRALHREIEGRLRATGLVTEDRTLSPHLTLARWRASHGRDRQVVQAAAPDGPLGRCPVTHVTLYESHLSSGRPVHIPMVETELEGR
jgi:2'-5' RNA ligase